MEKTGDGGEDGGYSRVGDWLIAQIQTGRNCCKV